MRTKILAIDGFGGAGKSTLAAALAIRLAAPIVHTDDFASWDHPLDWWPRLLAEVLEPLSRNEACRFRRTDWEGTGREEWVAVEPADVVILEGVGASRAVFRPFVTCAVWVETPREERLRRGLERDGEDVRQRWLEWMAEEDDYEAREQPRLRADVLVSGQRRHAAR